MPSTTPRLDVNRETVTKAKQAMMLRSRGHLAADEKELEKIPFSTTLATAADRYTKEITGLLNRAGFRKHPPLQASEKRPRRVDLDLWEELGNVAKEQGVARMELVRALLVLLGEESDNWQATQAAEVALTPEAKGPSA